MPLKGVRSTDDCGVYGELNDRGRCTDRKTAVQCSKLYVSLFLGLLHTKSIYAPVGGSQGNANFRTLVFGRYASPVAFLPAVFFKDLYK